ncbi:hypothetical protein OYC64_020779 [Pagothenia borchgrevinki]|uniref:Uncharacterized protein n=1 Tax=Pagothenia borchgrevinki TaxID=8213 RepID=A0ABD2FMJ6_PAGBO
MTVIEAVPLALLSLALLISVCLNVFFCIRQRSTLCKETDECCFRNMNTGASPSQDEGHYFHEHNHEELQENPIYGNISSDRADSVEVCYEMMTMEHATDRMKSIAPDLNYASLDLKLVKKRMKKNRHQQGPCSEKKQTSRGAAGPPHTPPEYFLRGGSRHGCSPSFQKHQHHGFTQQHLPEQSTDSPGDRGAGEGQGCKHGEGDRGLGGDKKGAK